MFGNRGFSPYGIYGISSAARSGINWSSLLSNTQKTLGIINQAIPAFYQIRPIFNNMKTMFRVVNEINKDDSKSTKTNSNNISNNIQKQNSNTTSDTYQNSYDNNDNNVNYNYDEGPSFFV